MFLMITRPPIIMAIEKWMVEDEPIPSVKKNSRRQSYNKIP